MTKKKEKTLDEKTINKKNYLSPKIEVIFVEMECGIAANSAAVSPGTVNGNTDQVQTDWNGNDDTTIIAPF
ncbi:hypothetical protein BAX97_16080 [Elizabethkingia meningoseptica]|uniref:hypothetical protein n=1 Tax=Elizabethkingia meningoseptica TaxID=238 RepID=UPI000332CB30|nr:hypothetical protein [Elizabethkingia meningoseptica]AQX05136.1 hypothetical protein BBD33_07695 [Elizabethkingia meningoseptica]AQX47180.1 hypothetical protein B5G46_07685 [Elizabethkingia meningoseptica]EOR28308.1 hypothetical protein L100_17055 [Elizabethkingia meningoseptica ATCC 13253 = NBRC 12535]KUY17845.1 hypothetical protein ATB99_06210 [Elizabethkingia meningoseptica]MDE5489242.1 hypothetical protein [Elizabethkingia meningoseptica]